MVSPVIIPQKSPAVRHWILQRISAVLMIPMAVWFVATVLPALIAGPSAFQTWIQSPVNGILALLWTVLLLFHGCLGMEVVFEDYVSCKRGRSFLIKGTRFLSGLAFFLTLFSVYQTL